MSYFELHAYVGTTKHMGGFEATQELIELCHVGGDTYVLDVGCGVGATACTLAKTHGCRVVGVDLRESMITRSNERAQRERVEHLVEFKVANALDLPFEDALFDAVLCESVATFIADKPRVVSELARVARPGGYVGLNEQFWLKPPPAEVVGHARRVWEIQSDLPMADDWRRMLESAGLKDVLVKTYRLDPRRESSQVRRYSLGDMLRMFYRTLTLYVRNPAFRAYMKKQRSLPMYVFEYLGYGVFAGRKG